MKKKIFTLFAFLTMFMGANAANWVEVYKADYSSNTGFPFYVMGYVPEWFDGVMTDFGANYRYATQDVLDNGDGNGNGKLTAEESIAGTVTAGGTEYQKVTGAGPYWHQYFIADGIPTQIDGHYKVVAVAKASEAVNITVNMGWGWGNGEQAAGSVSIGTDWAEVEWEYSGIAGASCNLVAQPGTSTATIEWKSVTVYEDQKEQRPVVWQEWLTSDGKSIIPGETPTGKYMGDAETPWTDPSVKFNDQTQNYLICAWSKEKGHNLNENNGWDPFPANIEADPANPSNHVYVCHGQPATTEGDASAWDNQFWIESPKSWKAGEQVKISFKYKASKNVTTGTQIHHQNPSDYMTWQGVGDVAFTTEWQTFEKTYTWPSDGAKDEDTGWSLCFNLNSTDKEAIDFYFDDLSWQSMKLDEGYFVAGSDPTNGLEYDFDNAVQFEDGVDAEGSACLVATIGSAGAYVSQVMISTVRGNDAAFKSNTIKLGSGTHAITNDPSDWQDYVPGSLAKLTLPGLGIWKIYLDPSWGSIAFEMIEGQDIVIKEIKPNPTEITVNALERDDLADGKDNDGNVVINENEGGSGQPWDNQFWIVANRTLNSGEKVTVKFKYKADKPAKASTQCHGEPGGYLHWAAIGDVNFTEEWQDFENTFTVAGEANGMKSIAFNLAEIREANNYYIKDVIWMLEDGTESLISEEGSINKDQSAIFMSKVVGGEISPATTGISSIVSDKKATNVTYNLAGQRVSKGYKGIVIKNGSKYIVK